MKLLFLIISNLQIYFRWRRVRRGVKTLDWKRGPGFYILPAYGFYNPIGEVQKLEMKSGKIGLYELIKYQAYRDPWDMIEFSYWHFLGYENEKPVKEYSFIEYLKLGGKA